MMDENKFYYFSLRSKIKNLVDMRIAKSGNVRWFARKTKELLGDQRVYELVFPPILI